MKNSEFLKEWLSGKLIQVHIGNTWYNISAINSCTGVPYHFEDDYTLRIKPKTVTSTTYIQHRTCKDNSPIHLVDSYNIEPNLELVWEDNTLISAKVL
jgi:hypothetical protein